MRAVTVVHGFVLFQVPESFQANRVARLSGLISDSLFTDQVLQQGVSRKAVSRQTLASDNTDIRQLA